MSQCGRISANVLIDCDDPMIGGTKDLLYLINIDDWLDATITRNGSNSQIIEGVTLPSSTVAYKFEGKNNSLEPKSMLAKGRYYELYDHEIVFKAFNNSPTVKQQIEALAKGKYVAIVENNHQGDEGNAAFEVYGDESGLELAESERIVTDTDSQGAYTLTLRTSEYAREGHLPATFFLTDYATTKALVVGLLTA